MINTDPVEAGVRQLREQLCVSLKWLTIRVRTASGISTSGPHISGTVSWSKGPVADTTLEQHKPILIVPQRC
jgi:hypothetical protein